VSLVVLFDIDGTLVDTAGSGRDAIEGALVEVFGTAGPIDELSFAGLTDPYIVRQLMLHAGFDDAEIDARLDALWAAYLGRLDAVLASRSSRLRVHPGVAALLDALQRVGAGVGLLTGNIEGGAHLKLGACGLAGRFGFGAFGSDAEDRDALPAIALGRAREALGRLAPPERTWVVGDTPRDIGCARAGGVRVLAVATGQFTVRDLRAIGPDHAVDTLADTELVLALLDGESRAAGEDATLAVGDGAASAAGNGEQEKGDGVA